MKKQKKRKPKWKWLRYRKGDVAHNLMCAAQRYIHAHKGTAVVVLGPIQIIAMPFDKPEKYTVGVACLGLRPERKK